MHSDLSPHLHTVECNIVISKLKECHADNTFLKFLGVCSDIDRELVKCLKKEREAKRKKNAEEGKRKREAMRLRMSTASSE
uniref:COX assembly mitochondrial protein n=1 Tax=Triatoma dimidiata TaxID=72491 RepID=A0A0V0G994_TRIDM